MGKPFGIPVAHSGLTGVFTEAFDWSGTSLVYHGWAQPGTAKSETGWAIVRHTYSGSDLTDTQWAGGKATFDNVWTDRVSLNYS